MERLSSKGVPPVAYERVLLSGAMSTLASVWEAGPAAEAEVTVSDEDVDRVLAAIAVDDVRCRRSKASWLRDLRRCFPSATPAAAKEWNHGGRDRAAEARGARMVFALGGEASASGGHARWLRRQDEAYLPPEGDERGFAVGADGYAVGWQGECQRMLGEMAFDAEGFAIDATTQVRRLHYEGRGWELGV